MIMVASYEWDGNIAASTNHCYDKVKKLEAMKANWWLTLPLLTERLFRVTAENQDQKEE